MSQGFESCEVARDSQLDISAAASRRQGHRVERSHRRHQFGKIWPVPPCRSRVFLGPDCVGMRGRPLDASPSVPTNKPGSATSLPSGTDGSRQSKKTFACGPTTHPRDGGAIGVHEERCRSKKGVRVVKPCSWHRSRLYDACTSASTFGRSCRCLCAPSLRQGSSHHQLLQMRHRCQRCLTR